MTFDATFFYCIEVILLFYWHTTMAINTLNNVQFITRPLFDSDASLSLNEFFDGNMTILTFNFFHFLPMMAFHTILHKCFAVVFTGRVATRTLQPLACAVCFMGKLDIIKRDGPPFYSNMAEARTGHPGLKFLWLIIFIDGRQGLFGFIIGRIEKLEGIFDIVNTLAQKTRL
jgi:hypothetical protein